MCASHLAQGVIHDRKARQNHSTDSRHTLLSVPQYADALEEGSEDDSDSNSTETNHGTSARSLMVTKRSGWRRVITKWQQEPIDSDSEEGPTIPPPSRR